MTLKVHFSYLIIFSIYTFLVILLNKEHNEAYISHRPNFRKLVNQENPEEAENSTVGQLNT